MKPECHLLSRRYQAALRRYLKSGRAARVGPALSLGRQAVASGLETLDVALMHEKALIALVVPLGAPAARDRLINRAKKFFAQAITPIEETHRAAMETAGRLDRLNRSLSRRALDLASSNRKLKIEIVRHNRSKLNLRQSERRTVLLLQQARLQEEQLRLLSRRILSVQEEERKRISRELHDVIAQMLTSINVQLAILKLESAANTEGLDRKISETQRLVEKSVEIVHRFASELRPAVLDDLGLIPALHSFMKSFSKETGILAGLTAFSGVEKVSSAKRTVLYRVAHEALTNIARHSKAARVDVTIRKLPAAVCMEISDDGKGFEALSAGPGKRLGLFGIRERVEMVGGTFTAESALGRGTTIVARIPFTLGAGKRPRA